MFIECIPENRVDLVTYETRTTATCSIGSVPFSATVVVMYAPSDRLLEFMQFEKWLKDREIHGEWTTIEALARTIWDKLAGLLRPVHLKVTVTAITTVHGPTQVQVTKEAK